MVERGCRFGPDSSRQTLEKPIFRCGLVPSVAEYFRKCIGDKSATLVMGTPKNEHLAILFDEGNQNVCSDYISYTTIYHLTLCLSYTLPETNS